MSNILLLKKVKTPTLAITINFISFINNITRKIMQLRESKSLVYIARTQDFYHFVIRCYLYQYGPFSKHRENNNS